MRWKLCKIYQKRVDDPTFNEINDAQLLWYQAQINLDMKEQFEMMRDIAEHNAMFTNPEGVQQVRDARDNSFETPDEDFDELLRETFGRSIDLHQQDRDNIDVLEMLKQDKMTSKYSDVMNMDLDDVKFTPFK